MTAAPDAPVTSLEAGMGVAGFVGAALAAARGPDEPGPYEY
jgi:hypothetical protein